MKPTAPRLTDKIRAAYKRHMSPKVVTFDADDLVALQLAAGHSEATLRKAVIMAGAYHREQFKQAKTEQPAPAAPSPEPDPEPLATA